MLQSRRDALAAEAVKGLEQDEIEFALGRIGEEFLELCAVAVFAAYAINVLVDDRPALHAGEFAQLGELILGVLFVPRADARVKSNFHLQSCFKYDCFMNTEGIPPEGFVCSADLEPPLERF
jgi:hypothetical protein